MRDWVTSRLRLPDLNEVEIKYISDADEDLVSFLSDCTPAHLKLLVVNWCSKNSNGIKSRFYINVLSKAAAKTSKLVFLTCIDFSAEDLQTVVKSSCNAERIVFCFCSIHCSSSLDFGADLSYNTKLLSFQGWGCTSFIERTTDWKEDPSCFSLIVDAIGSSGLRASLQKLSIAANQTLSKSKVQEELNLKGMPHISVVEEYIGPHSS